ncbi:MAG: phosphotransferase [Rhizomicrobium sp.]
MGSCRCRAICIWGTRDGQRFAVLEWIAGEPLHRVLGDAATRAALGREAGAVLARVHGVHFAQSGFLDERLEIARPFVADKAFLIDYLRGSLIAGGGARFVPRALVDAVMAYAERYGDLTWAGRIAWSIAISTAPISWCATDGSRACWTGSSPSPVRLGGLRQPDAQPSARGFPGRGRGRLSR